MVFRSKSDPGMSAARLLFLTKYARNGASSRYRSYQYLPYLENTGCDCTVSPLFDEGYLEHKYRAGGWRIGHLLRAFFGRVATLLRARKFDLVVIEYEVLPYFPAFFERMLNMLGIPYVVDYDDALFHQYDNHKNILVRWILGGKITRVMHRASLVVAGNRYLAEYARRSGADQVAVVPTVVDLERYQAGKEPVEQGGIFTIGWIGSPSTARYLEMIAPALAAVCADGNARVRLIGSGPVDLPGVPVDLVPWSEATEVEEIRRFDVGMMPLPDSPWERGKCGFKLIQYMACGLPVVASPVGVNSEIVEEGGNGFLAADHDAWIRALTSLRDDALLRQCLGAAGRDKVERQYSLRVTGPRLAKLLAEAARSPLHESSGR